jgi:hypothetical protein
MATYVPNVGQYLPELKTFTPDYKFLSNVLGARQTKYDTNYKQLNNAYSRILYSDLSRQDTQGARDQFVNDLQPTLEKISGLDLSLAQNVKAANAVFEPFYDNDLVMKDMVYTKNYKDNLAYAESLMYSTEQDTKDKYWKEGIEYMAIKMEDFKNASQEQAMGMALEQYVENPNLYKKARAYLKENNFTIEYDELSKGNDFIITNTNGENVTATILADLQEMFSNDPLINKAYYTQSYVGSRNYAKNQMEEGLVGSIQEGINKYNTGKVQAYKKSQEATYEKFDAKVEKLSDELNQIETNLKGGVPVPGSVESMYIKKIQNEIEGYNKQKEQLLQSITLADEILTSGDQKMINDRGYSIEMRTNIMGDLNAAATNYSMLTAKKKFTVNQAEINAKNRRHQARMQRDKFIFEESMKEKQSQLDAQKELAVYEGKLDIEKQRGIKRKDLIYDTDVSFLKGISDYLGLSGTGITRDVPGVEGITELDEKRYIVEAEKIADAQEVLVAKELNMYMSLYKSEKKGFKGMIKLPQGMDATEYEVTLDKENNRYLKQEDFKKLVTENEEAYKSYTDALYDELDTTKEGNEYKITANNNPALQALISLQDEKKDLQAKRDKYYETSVEQLRVAGKLSDRPENLPSIIQKDENNKLKLLTPEEYKNSIKGSEIYTPEYLTLEESIKELPYEEQLAFSNTIGASLGKFVLDRDILLNYFNKDGSKNKNSLPSDFLIDKTVFVKGKPIKSKRFNPKYFKYEYGSSLNPNRQFDALLNQGKSIKRFGQQRKRTEELLFDVAGIANYDEYMKMSPSKKENTKLINSISNTYDDQLEELDQIQKGTYLDPINEQPISGIPYYSFVAEELQLQDPNAKLPTLMISKKTQDVMDNNQYKALKESGDLSTMPTSIRQAQNLEHALKLGATDITIDYIKAGVQKFEGAILPAQEEESKGKGDVNRVITILNQFKTGNLDGDYIIEYEPNTDPEGVSKYNIIKKEEKGANQKSPLGYTVGERHVINVPNKYDVSNEFNPLNDKTSYILHSLIDPNKGNFTRTFPGNTNVTVIDKGNGYEFETDLYLYNDITGNYDLLSTVDVKKYLPSFNLKQNLNNYRDANVYYSEQVKLLTDWSSSQLDKKEKNQRYYKEWILNNVKGATVDNLSKFATADTYKKYLESRNR